MSGQRARRVAEEIKKELSQIIRSEMKDPRMGFLSVTDVEISADLRVAKVFVSIMGSEKEQALSMGILQRAVGFLRTELGKRIRLRYTPELSFHLDSSIAQGAKIDKLLRELETKSE
jgi:ribosome-binding factor A